jgi:putative GTP pyrophosphokinase
MPLRALSGAEQAAVDPLLAFYHEKQSLLSASLGFITNLITAEPLTPFVHSVKARIKSESSMRHKLARKVIDASDKGAAFDITRDNFFSRITDSIGARLLHLSFQEFSEIHPTLLQLFAETELTLVETPKAYTWDPDYQRRFQELGLDAMENANYYTSVHYTVASGQAWTAEIQVRTLAEELWGEVDHKFNYPDPNGVRACRDEIRVLAKQIASCSTLVDSIYVSAAEG